MARSVSEVRQMSTKTDFLNNYPLFYEDNLAPQWDKIQFRTSRREVAQTLRRYDEWLQSHPK